VTTIATRGDGVVAADSQCSGDDAVLRVTKLFQMTCGGVVGGCGDFPEIVRAVEWLRTRSGEPPELTETELLICYGDGRVGTVSDGKWIFTATIGPVAIGSGRQAALAAMRRFDATALEAVEAAATVDPSTSGPFQVMTVEPKRAARKRTR
jgi:hypothetical protein